MRQFFCLGLPVAACAMLLFSPLSMADGLPPSNMLDAMFPVLRHKAPPDPPTQSSFSKATDRSADASCGLIPINLTQTTGTSKRVFKLLGEPQSDADSQPSSMLIRLSRMAVDADGSHRAYHPDDPSGLCRAAPHQTKPNACAIDVFSNGEIHLFKGGERIPQFKVLGGRKKSLPNPDFANVWSALWPQIAARKDQWINLETIFGDQAPPPLRLYYSSQNNTAVIFNTKIIPFKGAYPCQYQDKTDEYFVAATTAHAAPDDPQRDACSTATYLDAMDTPFFVLPDGVFSHLAVGDIVVAWAKVGDTERRVYGIVGDTGPQDQIGEGSIRLARELRSMKAEPANALEAKNLDLDISNHPAGITSLAMLVLGGTAKDLGFDFSRTHIEAVATQALAKWETTHPGRLRSCVNSVPANPLQGFNPAAR